MSMYTHLLGVARGQRAPRAHNGSAPMALAEARRRRDELKENMPEGHDPDAVPAALALEISYDVALIELADTVGVPTDPSRFEQPERERARLERELAARGIDLDTPATEDAVG